MADPDNEDLNLTEEVEANLAIEQGLGVGARELAAQLEAGQSNVNDDETDDDQAADLSDGRAQIKSG